MLEIRPTQIQAFEEAQWRRFVHGLAGHLRGTFADKLETLDDDGLLEFVRFCCAWAGRYGIELDCDVRRFAEFAVLYGRRMDEEYAWIGEVLGRDDLSGTEKMDMLDTLEPQHLENRQ